MSKMNTMQQAIDAVLEIAGNTEDRREWDDAITSVARQYRLDRQDLEMAANLFLTGV